MSFTGIVYDDPAIKSEIRKLARKGKLMDHAFKAYQRQVYPAATPDQIATLRTSFFAGAAETYALMCAGMDDGLAETDGDITFMNQWVNEVQTFYLHTIAASTAKGRAQ